MSYENLELSVFQAFPLELYHFKTTKNGEMETGEQSWGYTSAPIDVVFPTGNVTYPNGMTFKSTQITRSETTKTADLNKLSMTITVPKDNEVALMYQFYPPTSVITVDIRRSHRTDVDQEIFVHWMGRISSVEFNDEEGVARLTCEPVHTSIRRLGLRRHYQRECPHILYSEACGVAKENYQVSRVVQSISGLTVALGAALPGVDNDFAGGMLSWTNTGKPTQWRFILSNTTTSLQVNFPFPDVNDPYGRGLHAGSSITIYKGCTHTMTDCVEKFNNLDNYGGFPYIPMENPFGMTTLY